MTNDIEQRARKIYDILYEFYGQVPNGNIISVKLATHTLKTERIACLKARTSEVRNVMIMIQDFSVKPVDYLDTLHDRITELTKQLEGEK